MVERRSAIIVPSANPRETRRRVLHASSEIFYSLLDGTGIPSACILTGEVGSDELGDPFTEAFDKIGSVAGGKFFLLREGKSRNTRENVAFSFRAIGNFYLDWKVSTDRLHFKRFEDCLRCGVQEGYLPSELRFQNIQVPYNYVGFHLKRIIYEALARPVNLRALKRYGLRNCEAHRSSSSIQMLKALF
jgi:hypothetical protein